MLKNYLKKKRDPIESLHLELNYYLQSNQIFERSEVQAPPLYT